MSHAAADRLSLLEVEALLRGMVIADWDHALRIARMRAAGLNEWTGEMLLAEAIVKLQSGERVWRRGVHPLVTLKVAMHSIASNVRKREARAPFDRYADVVVGADNEGTDVVERVSAFDAPEEIVDSRQQLAAIEKLVADDDEAEKILVAWSEGLRGREAADDLGLDMQRYDAARHRLLRRLERVAASRYMK